MNIMNAIPGMNILKNENSEYSTNPIVEKCDLTFRTDILSLCQIF